MKLMLAFVLILAACGSAEQKPGYWVVTDAQQLVKAVSKATPLGGTIVLRPGTYVIEKTLVFEGMRLLNIEGGGWSTQIHRKGEGDAIVFKDSAFCVVRNLLIAGDPKAKTGSAIHYQGQSSSCTVDFCRLTGFAESGVRYTGDTKSPMSSNTIRDCHFIDNRGHQLWSVSNNDFYMDGNQFGDGTVGSKTGCLLDRSSAGTYSRNYHWGNVNAFKMLRSHFNRIENNRFENSRETGVIIGEPNGEACQLHIFIGNTIHTNTEAAPGKFAAMEAYNAHDITFCDNQVFSWNSAALKHKSSLVLDDKCMHWIIKDNIFRHNVGSALVYSEKGGHIVKDNQMDGQESP
ncbi:MAG TPA: right-handed parallel beta-helix repeat-containing protein [Armatimonadota bacterium]|nr:right-handed parallel beta-helix repeat-containing protein [Armatimonadota bacterium]